MRETTFYLFAFAKMSDYDLDAIYTALLGEYKNLQSKRITSPMVEKIFPQFVHERLSFESLVSDLYEFHVTYDESLYIAEIEENLIEVFQTAYSENADLDKLFVGIMRREVNLLNIYRVYDDSWDLFETSSEYEINKYFFSTIDEATGGTMDPGLKDFLLSLYYGSSHYVET